MSSGLVTKEGFEPNHKEFGLHIRSVRSTEFSAEPIALQIAGVANHSVPWKPKKKGDRKRKHLRDSYTARADGNLRVGGNTRAIWVVESNVLEASTKEFGTKFQRPSYPLLRAAMVVIHVELPGGANIQSGVDVTHE